MTEADAASFDTGGVFAAIDRQDTAAFVGFLTDDAVFRFGSAPPVQGRDAIAAAVGGFFDTIADLAHRIDNSVVQGSSQFIEGEVTYTRRDGSQITLPFADVFEYEGDLIAHYKIYMDISPLYSD
jgi:ketosteroid isomerase-like protein